MLRAVDIRTGSTNSLCTAFETIKVQPLPSQSNLTFKTSQIP